MKKILIVISLMVLGLVLLCSSIPVHSSQPIVVAVQAQDTVIMGENFIVEITISDVIELYGCAMDLEFNSNILQVENIEYGDFLTSDGAGSMRLKLKYNNTVGLVQIDESRLGPIGINGTGCLGKITFNAIEVGNSFLNLSLVLTDSTPAYITPDQIINDTVSIIQGDISLPNKTVIFSDKSLGGADAEIANWEWKLYYENGTLFDCAYDRNLTYTFPDYGKYYINLTVTNECGNENSTGLRCIDTGCPMPIADFTHTALAC